MSIEERRSNGRAPYVTTYIGVGANLGPALVTVMQAVQDIAALPGVRNTRISPLYRSAPVDAGGPDYINAVLKAETTLAPETLLESLLEIEQQHGRARPYPNAPRSLDLDLLLYANERRNTDFLTLPHPRMHERAFVLQPLLDLAPELVLAQGTLIELLTRCKDQRLEKLAGY